MSDLSSSSAKPDDLDVESSEPDPSRPSSFKGNSEFVKTIASTSKQSPENENEPRLNYLIVCIFKREG